MAVLVEGISVVIRRDVIAARYPGGWDGFVRNVPNRTLCADAAVARVGFMTPTDVEHFVAGLERHGFRFIVDESAIDLAVVDQAKGPTSACEWLSFGFGEIAPGQRVAGAALVGSAEKALVMPDGWKYEGSLSQKFTFVPTGEEKERLKFLCRQNDVDVFLDLVTGKKVYCGRTSE
jgi:hypothetical protein